MTTKHTVVRVGEFDKPVINFWGEPMQEEMLSTEGKRVLDVCCGSRMFWLDRENPDVVFGDQRRETVTVTDRSHGRAEGTRTLHIDPDILLDFRALPYPDGSFRLVAFDPPHLVRAGPKSWLAAKYGKLGRTGAKICDWVLRSVFGCWTTMAYWSSSGTRLR
jgi:hypothetical protein